MLTGSLEPLSFFFFAPPKTLHPHIPSLSPAILHFVSVSSKWKTFMLKLPVLRPCEKCSLTAAILRVCVCVCVLLKVKVRVHEEKIKQFYFSPYVPLQLYSHGCSMFLSSRLLFQLSYSFLLSRRDCLSVGGCVRVCPPHLIPSHPKRLILWKIWWPDVGNLWYYFKGWEIHLVYK